MTHAANIITTADGYMFTQLPSGWYTDGDVEFDINNTDIFGLRWEAFQDDGATVYCADGDGFVTVESDEHGWWYINDQGEPVAEFDNLRAALMAAQSYLAATYHAIYEANIE